MFQERHKAQPNIQQTSTVTMELLLPGMAVLGVRKLACAFCAKLASRQKSGSKLRTPSVARWDIAIDSSATDQGGEKQ